jgi:hypothetical protein
MHEDLNSDNDSDDLNDEDEWWVDFKPGQQRFIPGEIPTNPPPRLNPSLSLQIQLLLDSQ